MPGVLAFTARSQIAVPFSVHTAWFLSPLSSYLRDVASSRRFAACCLVEDTRKRLWAKSEPRLHEIAQSQPPFKYASYQAPSCKNTMPPFHKFSIPLVAVYVPVEFFFVLPARRTRLERSFSRQNLNAVFVDVSPIKHAADIDLASGRIMAKKIQRYSEQFQTGSAVISRKPADFSHLKHRLPIGFEPNHLPTLHPITNSGTLSDIGSSAQLLNVNRPQNHWSSKNCLNRLKSAGVNQ
ncbi:hypothetical protein B0H19DRAFT_1071337 [Mycena capillaripes]|nr:hypothetical protein B0H19DRAFT_1071337 [Mycena capillaripes]